MTDNDKLSIELRDRTNRIEAEIIRRAEETGTTFRFPLSREHDPSLRECIKDNFGELMMAMADVLITPREEVVVARREGVWQLRYLRVEPGASAVSRDQPLRDASLDVRRKFLEEFPRFMEQFTRAIAARVTPISATIAKADEALRLLSETNAPRPSVETNSSMPRTQKALERIKRRPTPQGLKAFAEAPLASTGPLTPENLKAFADAAAKRYTTKP